MFLSSPTFSDSIYIIFCTVFSFISLKKMLFSSLWMDRIDSHLVLNLVGKQRRDRSCRTVGVVAALSPVLEAPLKCQRSVWKRDNLTDQSGISSFIIHSEPIQSLGAQGHHTLSSMPPLIIRPHQRLFGLSNQCLFNGMPSLQGDHRWIFHIHSDPIIIQNVSRS